MLIWLGCNFYNHGCEHLLLGGPASKFSGSCLAKACLFGESMGPVVATVQENGETRSRHVTAPWLDKKSVDPEQCRGQ